MSSGGGEHGGGEKRTGLPTRALILVAKGVGALVVTQAAISFLTVKNDGVDQAADHLRAWGYTEVTYTDTDVILAGRGECDLTDNTELDFTAIRPDDPNTVEVEGGLAQVAVCMGLVQKDPTIIDPGFTTEAAG